MQIFKSQKKQALPNKKCTSSAVWTHDRSPGVFTINVTFQVCYTFSYILLSVAELRDGIDILVLKIF